MTDTQAQSDQPQMPSRHDMVVEAIARLATVGVRSELVKLPKEVLVELCMRLTDRTLTWADAHRWLSDISREVDDNQLYRFKDRFLAIYQQVRAEHVRRIAKLSVADATGENITKINRVGQHLLAELITESLIDTPRLEEMSTKQITAISQAVRRSQQTQIDREQLVINEKIADEKVRQLEVRNELLDKDLELAQQKINRLPEQVKSALEKIEKLESAHKGGKRIDPSIFASIRDELIALTGEVKA